MSPDHPSTPSAKAAKRQQILDAAGDLFAVHGMFRTKVEDVAAAAGVSVGTIYGYFGSKQDLALAFVADGIDVLERLLDEAHQIPTPLARVFGAGDAYFRWAVEKPIACRFAAIRVLQPDADPEFSAVNAQLRERIGGLVLRIAEDVKKAMTTGEIPAAPIEETMVFLWAAWNGVTALMVRQDGLAISADAGRRALDLGRTMMMTAVEHTLQGGAPAAWARPSS